MRKNRTMRVAALLLALTLITSCFVGGTFAKYTTTGTASDGARVAKWGVEIFATENGSVFANEYDATGDATGIVVKANEKVVAPGTSSAEVNNTLVFGVTGTPEVATKITTTFNGTDIFYGEYHPIQFKLYCVDNNAVIADTANVDWGNAVVTGTLENVTTAINNYASFNCAAGETLDILFKIEWSWDFDANGVGTNDTADTALGNLVAEGKVTSEAGATTAYNTKLSYGVTVTVEQVD